MDQPCQKCCQLSYELDEETEKVERLEQELSACETRLKIEKTQSETRTMIHDGLCADLERKIKNLEAKNLELTQKSETTRVSLQEVLENELKNSQVIRNLRRKEEDHLEIVRRLEKENQELRENQAPWETIQGQKNQKPSRMDADLVEQLLQRVQILEATTSESPTSSSAAAPTNPLNSTLEDQKIMLLETKFAMEAFPPDVLAEELFQNLCEKSKDEELKKQAKRDLDMFKSQFRQYMVRLENAVEELSSAHPPRVHDSDLPIFPAAFDMDFMAKYETALKNAQKSILSIAQGEKCPICQARFENDGRGCVGCGMQYHRECGNVFAQRNLTCYGEKCSRKFAETKWI